MIYDLTLTGLAKKKKSIKLQNIDGDVKQKSFSGLRIEENILNMKKLSNTPTKNLSDGETVPLFSKTKIRQ